MRIPVVEKFFGCMELRQATICIGWAYGVLLTLSFVGFLLSLLSSNTNGGGSVATAIISIVSIVFCVLLVLGAQRENPRFVVLGYYFLAFHAVLLVITVLVSLLSIGLVVLFIYLPLAIYCALTVRSYYLQMSGSTSPGGTV